MLAGGPELLETVVGAGLLEEIGGDGHIGWRAVALEVVPARSRREVRAFVELPYRLHANAAQWVPPLRIERRLFLDRRLNAYFKHGEAEYLLARRDGRVVGRLSAQVDRAFNDFHDSRWGMFGFLELEEDGEVLAALLEAAARWLRERGCYRMVGPMDFSMNDESGVLIEGFDRPPMVKQPWHPPYYQELCEQAGLEKAMDLYMWELHISDREKVLPVIFELAERAEAEHGITIRRMSRRHLRRELDGFAEVYNAAWRENWGFVPYSKEDLDYHAQELHLAFDRHWFMVAEKDGETVAMAITVPDLNQVLRRMNGRLLPLGWWHFLRRGKIMDRVRVGFLGVKPEYQHTGVAAALYVEHFNMASARPQTWGEMGWILETNTAMNRGMEAMGGRIVKRYRVYERRLGR
jgi:GNAT superfamily N-acetyltransferase